MWRGLDEQLSYINHLGFVSHMVRELDVKEMVEVGVLFGALSKIVLSKCLGVSTYYLVDPWKVFMDPPAYTQKEWDRRYNRVKSLMTRYGERAKILRMTSLEASKVFKPESLDMVYLDANHSFKYVDEDIKAWWPKIRPNGYLTGHDLIGRTSKSKTWHGVREAVEANFGKQYHSGGRRWDGVWVVSKEEVKL